MPGGAGPRINLRPGPFLRAAADRLDVRSRRGFPVTVAVTVAILAFLGFLSIAEEVLEPLGHSLDQTVMAFAVAIRTPLLTQFYWVMTLLGDARVMVVATLAVALLMAATGHPRRAGSVVILMMTAQLISWSLKDAFSRPRPPAALALIPQPISASFPSGHALAGIVLFGTLALMLAVSKQPKALRVWGTIGIAFVGLSIGASRVYLGVHYPSDVLGSWMLGLTMLATWAAAVLIWGRTHPPEDKRIFAPWGPPWLRWVLAGVCAAAIAIALSAAAVAVPLL